MPTNHVGNTANGNAVGAIASHGNTLQGRITGLPIYEVRYYDLVKLAQSGPHFDTLVRSINPDNKIDLVKGYRQTTDHEDRLGNLPVAPGGKVVYREYYLKENLFAWSGFVRIVADRGTRRLFITPTHYDVYLVDAAAAAHANANSLINPTTPGAHNPFFLITGASAVNSMFL